VAGRSALGFAARSGEPGSKVRSREPQPEESGPNRKWRAEGRVAESRRER
jgi:hypothetical protein